MGYTEVCILWYYTHDYLLFFFFPNVDSSYFTTFLFQFSFFAVPTISTFCPTSQAWPTFFFQVRFVSSFSLPLFDEPHKRQNLFETVLELNFLIDTVHVMCRSIFCFEKISSSCSAFIIVIIPLMRFASCLDSNLFLWYSSMVVNNSRALDYIIQSNQLACGLLILLFNPRDHFLFNNGQNGFFKYFFDTFTGECTALHITTVVLFFNFHPKLLPLLQIVFFWRFILFPDQIDFITNKYNISIVYILSYLC